MGEQRTPLEEIKFLADSDYRSAVLARVNDGPSTRAELRRETGASSATLCRVLRAFEARDWLVRTDRGYELTPFGTFVAAGFGDLLRRMEVEGKLSGIWREMPATLLALDPDWIADASITLPTRQGPFAPTDRAAELVDGTARSRLLTHALLDPCLVAHRDGITAGSHRFEAVVTEDVVQALAASTHAPWIGTALSTDRFEVYVTDGEVPQVIGVNDDAVYFGIADERGAPLALIETDDGTVVDWAESTFESYRRDAVALFPDGFSRLRETDGSNARTARGPETVASDVDPADRRLLYTR